MKEQDHTKHIYISYRDEDDIKPAVTREEKYAILLAQALNTQPRNKTERKLLEDYINTLKELIECHAEINDVKRIIGGLDSFYDKEKIAHFRELLRKKEKRIRECEQNLEFLNSDFDLDAGLLKRILERDNEGAQQDTRYHEKTSMKEKFVNALGGFGIILFFAIRLIISILPFVMIGGNFFLTLILIGINTFVPFASVVFWIWGLVCAIKGVQDFFAILYYIAFVVIWLPFFISTVISAFSKGK